MSNIVVGIHQPNFMPWLGYFYKIWQSDIFIFLDDVQFQKTGASYTNRVSICINGESKYLTISVQRKSGVWNINDTLFQDKRWRKKTIATFQANYAKATFFKEYKDFIFSLIEYETDNLSEFNINFITHICKELDITTKLVKSSEYNLQTTSTQRLIDLIKNVDGNVYLSGNGGDNYQEHDLYEKENIELIYNKMPKFEYPQFKTEEFIGGLSIVDAIFNIGLEDLKKGLFIND